MDVLSSGRPKEALATRATRERLQQHRPGGLLQIRKMPLCAVERYAHITAKFSSLSIHDGQLSILHVYAAASGPIPSLSAMRLHVTCHFSWRDRASQ